MQIAYCGYAHDIFRYRHMSPTRAKASKSGALAVQQPGFDAHVDGMRLACSLDMARGWESKSVEAQQEEAIRSGQKRATAAELATGERRRTLELTRKRALDDLSRASAPAHRDMLEHAIASLDEQLATLKRESAS